MVKIITVSLLVMFAAINSYADVVFVIDQKEMSPESMNQINGKVKSNNLRMDFIDNGTKMEGSMIYLGDKKEIIIVNHDDKSYMIMDEATMNSLANQMEQAMNQMEQAMKDMPPDQREKIKEMMKSKMPGMGGGEYVEPVLKEVGTGEVNGIKCTKYDVYKGDERVRQHCVAKWSSIEGGEEMKAVMIQMADFMDQMTKSFSKKGGMMGSQMQFERNVFNQLKKMNGFPVETIEYEGEAVEAESTFKSSKKESVPGADMQPPAGYTLQTMGPQ